MTNPSITTVNDSLAHKASKSVFWTVFSNMGVSIINFGTTMVMARLLSPTDFGLLGMATLVTGTLGLLGNISWNAAILQKQDCVEDHLSTAHWAYILTGIILTLIGIASAPFAAHFFREPSLQSIIVCLSFNFIIEKLAHIRPLLLVRALQFKTLAIIEVATGIVRGVTILIFAFMGWAVWSIVWGMLIERITKAILFVSYVKWRPQWIFNKAKLRELFDFGKNIYGESLVDYLNTNIAFILTGRLLGATTLGFYNFAFNIPHLVLTHVSEGVSSVVYPLYCQMQNDIGRVARGYLKTTQYISLVTFPALAGLFFVAYDFVHLVYGAKWLSVIVPLKILCISGALLSITKTNGLLCAAIGKPQMSFRWKLMQFPFALMAVAFGSHWGIVGVAWAMAFMAIVSLIFIRCGVHLVGTSFRQYLYILWPATGSSFLMLCVMFAINELFYFRDLLMWLRFSFNVLLGASLYILFMRFIFQEVFHDFLGFIRKMFQ